MPVFLKDFRCKFDDQTHKALSVIAEHEGVSMERWVVDLVQREVTRQMALAKRLSVLGDLALVPTTHRPRWIYFVQRGPDGPIKIGVTTRSVSERIRNLQIGCAELLRLLAAVPESEGLRERSLHSRFKKHRQEGEWFAPTEELLSLIDELESKSVGDAA